MEKIVKLNIKNLLQNDSYIIPLYQRNYAWEREEIQQLLSDISETKGNYYLGTLIVSKNNSGQYNIIDGQQRHTTLSIINAVFNYRGYEVAKSRNLNFEAREKSEKIIDNLLINKASYQKAKHESSEDKGIQNILKAVQDIEDFLDEKFKTTDSEKEFVSRFYNEIVIFRAELPENTDLNHYFEIMNNRGEQLEEHEILKAAFMSKPEVNGYEKQVLFSKIWEACSQMNCHVQMCFIPEERTLLFGDLYQDIPNLQTLNDYIVRKESQKTLTMSDNGEIEKKGENYNSDLLSIIDNYILPLTFNQNKNDEFIEKFNSIIDFPNFLLQILKLENDEVSLDDKALLYNFGYPTNLPDAWDFIYKLLKYRALFDRFIVKREGESNVWSWSLKTVVKNNDYQITFPHENDVNYRRKIRMIQAMYQVTFPSNNYKNWLFEIMKLFKEKTENHFSSEVFLFELEKQAVSYYNKNNIGNFLNNGLQTPRFLFNFLDYLLWEIYYDRIRGNSSSINNEHKTLLDKINKERDKFDSFKFVQRSSIEHLFPQSRHKEILAETEDEKKSLLNSFGNLCLISRNSNSAYNSDMPFQKKHDSKSRNESLKQLIMFGSFDGENWNTKEIKAHQMEMTAQLTEKTKLYD